MEFSDPRAAESLKAAEAASARAYVPYSRFRMEAAMTATNAVVPGALVENVSFGLAMCAERAALFGVVARGEGKPEVLALFAPRTNGKLTWPYGACHSKGCGGPRPWPVDPSNE